MQYQGILSITKFGSGFVNCNDGISILIPKENINYSINGDKVDVIIINTCEKGFIGNIISKPSFIGKEYISIIHHFHNKYIYVYVEELGKKNLICLQYNKKVKINDYLYIKINNIIKSTIFGTVIEYIGIFGNDCFKYKFNLKEIENYELKELNPLIVKRVDLISHNVFTIDPFGSKDLDDAFSIMVIDNKYHIYIHISDVTEYIYPGVSYFEEIMKRSNTNYGINHNWTMLPRNLSDNICSLLPNKRSYAITNEFIYDGSNINYCNTYYSIIESKKQYTYDDIDILLENKSNNDINILYESSKIINNILDMFPMNTTLSTSHKIVELYMLLTNKIMGDIMFEKNTGIFRTHPSPYINQIQTLKKFFKPLSNNPNRNEILDICKEYTINNTSFTYEYIIKDMMRKAIYVSYKDNHEHYALGINNYIHFTSPIRRASDLINHLIIRGYLFTDSEIDKYCLYFNEGEIIQLSIENMILRNDLIIYFSNLVGKQIDAVIINISKTGIRIFISNGIYQYEDDIHISKLSYSKLIFNGNLENEYNSYKLFDTIKICIDSVNITRYELEIRVIL